MSIAMYMLIGSIGAAIYAFCLWGGLELLKRRDLQKGPGPDA